MTRHVLHVLLLLPLTTWLGSAQRFEFSLAGGFARMGPAPLGSINEENKKDNDTTFRSGEGLGARFTWNTPGYYGHEFGYNYNHAKLRATIRGSRATDPVVVKQDRILVQQAFYTFLIYFMPAGERFRPFMAGGLHGARYGAPAFEEWDRGAARTYGAHYGAGLKIRLFKGALIRFDVRDYINGKPYDLRFEDEMKFGGLYRQQEFSFGLAVTF